MTVYTACEDYTCALFGVYRTREEAEAKAEEIGGFVEEWEV